MMHRPYLIHGNVLTPVRLKSIRLHYSTCDIDIDEIKDDIRKTELSKDNIR